MTRTPLFWDFGPFGTRRCGVLNASCCGSLCRAKIVLQLSVQLRLCWLGGLGKPESRQHLSLRRSLRLPRFPLSLTQEQAVFTILMNRGCVVQLSRPLPKELGIALPDTPQSLLRNKKITSASRLKALSKVGTTVISVSCFFRECCRGQHFRFSSGRTLRESSSSAGTTPA